MSKYYPEHLTRYGFSPYLCSVKQGDQNGTSN